MGDWPLNEARIFHREPVGLIGTFPPDKARQWRAVESCQRCGAGGPLSWLVIYLDHDVGEEVSLAAVVEGLRPVGTGEVAALVLRLCRRCAEAHPIELAVFLGEMVQSMTGGEWLVTARELPKRCP